MEDMISKEQSLELLKQIQQVQLFDMGKHKIDITCFNDDDGFWFTFNARSGENFTFGSCYNFLTYEENKANLDDFVKRVSEFDKSAV